ncbi:MAG TPA: phospho-sugar mutase [Bacteroidales bacterium]|nr:phospho-sugar mutase [Bacteroidales bacterium]
MEKAIIDKINVWLGEGYDSATQAEIKKMLADNPSEIVEAFYKNLEFGTGGLRGIMGVGTNRMNRYTVGSATQGLSNYLKKISTVQPIQVAIAFDSRNRSQEFAQIAAEILAANDIICYLFDNLRPTPVLSFAVRHLHCQAGIVITASHNPKEYNGYKVYWNDGGQLVSPHDEAVIREVNAVTSVSQIRWKGNDRNIKIIGKNVDEVYLQKIAQLSLNPDAVHAQNQLRIVYTSLHGTGITLVPQALQMFGFQNITIVEEQKTPDGNFPTVKSPNPEEKSAMEIAIRTADEVHADLVLATDPDADRVGIAIRNNNGKMELLNGNMTASLLIYYVLSQWKERGKLSGKEFIVKTIVTSELVREIAENFGVMCEDVLTGFKYIAEKIKEYEGTHTFIIGGEESYGYLVSDFVRDKDAVSSCCMIAEMAAFYANQGKTLYQMLQMIYRQFGFYKEELLSITKKGQSGAADIQKIMDNFRNNPPQLINKEKVIKINDYLKQISVDVLSGNNFPILMPKSDVLQFFTADGSKITVRPSGTEPKIKFYFGVKKELSGDDSFSSVSQELSSKIKSIIESLEL